MAAYLEMSPARSDTKSLVFLMVQMLGMPSHTMLGKIQSEAATLGAPKILESLQDNVKVMGK
jgi:hypothetical protein